MEKITLPEDVQYIIGALEKGGYEAFAVGGCIRDSVLGRCPNDWDITTSAPPEAVKSIFKRTVDTGIAHGTVTVMLDKTGYEVTTYRIDGAYEDNRHPKEVSFTGNLLEDLRRRDFTINAMAYNERSGLVDAFGGIRDLQEGMIRCVGSAEERFSEDALRIARAVRFAAQLGFSLEEGTYAAAKKLAGTLSRISAERVQVELVKLLTSPHPEWLRLAYDAGITAVILPEFDRMMNQPQGGAGQLTVGEHALEALRVSAAQAQVNRAGRAVGEAENTQASRAQVNRAGRAVGEAENTRASTAPDAAPPGQAGKAESGPALSSRELTTLRLGLLLAGVGKPECVQRDESGGISFPGCGEAAERSCIRILKRLRFDNETITGVCRLVRCHACFPRSESAVRRLITQVGEERFPLLLMLQRQDQMAEATADSRRMLDCLAETGEMYRRITERGDCLSLKSLAIGGCDLIADGMKPGKAIGAVLGRLLEQVLEEPSRNQRAYLLEEARRIRREMGGL